MHTKYNMDHSTILPLEMMPRPLTPLAALRLCRLLMWGPIGNCMASSVFQECFKISK